MSQTTNELLSRVAEETFESLTFMYPVGAEESPAGTTLTAEVSFSGPCRGRLVLSLADTMLPALATNMLGLEFDQSPTSDQQNDAVKEVLNVICGNLLPLLFSSRDVFDVQAPMILATPAEGGDPQGQAQLFLDGGQVQLALYVERSGYGLKVA